MADLAGSTVWVLIVNNRVGTTVTLHATCQGATRELALYCYEFWHDSDGTWPEDLVRPENDEEALIDAYFEAMEGKESYILEGQAVGV